MSERDIKPPGRAHRLRRLGDDEMARVHGGLLLPAVQKIRSAAAPRSASDIYIKIPDIKGEDTW